MSKPDPLPVLRGKDAKSLHAKLEEPTARPEAKTLFAGALTEYRAAEARARRRRVDG